MNSYLPLPQTPTQNFFAIHSRAAANSKVDWPSSLPNLKINLATVARQGAQERVD